MKLDKVLSDFQFVGSSVRSFSMDNTFVNIGDVKAAARDMDVSYQIVQIEKQTFEEQDVLMGIINLFLSIDVDSEEGHLRIYLCIQGCFCSRDAENEEEFKNMLCLNGCTTLYSISRSLIASMTAQASVEGSIVLPMMNTFRLNEEIEKEENNQD